MRQGDRIDPRFPVTGGNGARVNRDDLMERMRKARMKQQQAAGQGRIRMPARRGDAIRKLIRGA